MDDDRSDDETSQTTRNDAPWATSERDPIAEPAGPGEPIDSIVMLAADDGRSQQYDGDGRLHHHADEPWFTVCVPATPPATAFFENCRHEILASSDALCLALADGTVVASGAVRSVGQQVETLFIAVAAPASDGDEVDQP